MKILMIGAHQDDNEFRCGGIAYKYVQLGHEVRFLSLTNGSCGHHILSRAETQATRAKESQAVAELLGVTYDIWDDVSDASIMPDLPLRRRLIRYIRNFNPDLVITHRSNDYHADHRAAGILVQDASYLLTVPHECEDVPAMRLMPVIMYNEDGLKNPEFQGDVVVGIDDVVDVKMKMADLNVSQVYEWLPYTHCETAPEGKEERFEWLKGMDMSVWHSDEEIMSYKSYGYGVRYAKTAARFRKELIERYGEERGSKIRYAEAFEICGFGRPLTEELKAELFPF